MAIYELKNEEIKIKEIQERKECILWRCKYLESYIKTFLIQSKMKLLVYKESIQRWKHINGHILQHDCKYKYIDEEKKNGWTKIEWEQVVLHY